MSAAHNNDNLINDLIKVHFAPQSYAAATTCIVITTFATAALRCGKAIALLLAEKEVNYDNTTNDARI
jgi:hypothetical protein